MNEVTKEPDAECLQRANEGKGECLRYKNPNLWRSVLMDFEYAGIAFAGILAQAPIPRPASPPFDFRGRLTATQKSAYPRFLDSRMPGTNIWRLPNIHAEYGDVVAKRVDEANDRSSSDERDFTCQSLFGHS